MVALDFFCGAGGLTRGLLDAGIRVRAGIDNDERLKDTYELNNKPSLFVCEDINDIDIERLRRSARIRDDHIVMYAACTPCQPFSTLNQRRGIDDRKELLLAFGRIVRKYPPDYVLVENVPGLHNAYGREIHLKFLADLAAAGFADHDGREIDAADYGVPQVRKRYLLVASRHGPIRLPGVDRGARRTVRDALAKLPPPVFIDEKHAPALPNHVARRPRPHHIRILEAVPADGGNRGDVIDVSVLLKCHQDNPGVHKDVFSRMRWDSPAPTLTCRCTDVYCGRFAHPEEHRGLSLREAAALQTFPPDYEFCGSFFHAAAQIGNAVPVLLAQRLGRAVRRHMIRNVAVRRQS